MLELYGKKQDGRFELSAVQEDMERQYFESLKEGQLLKKTYIKQGPMKTHQQVKTHFGLVVEAVRRRLETMGMSVCGVPANKNMVYDILKKACGGVGDMGQTLGLSEMSVDEASLFFENCNDWAATELHFVIPKIDKDWKKNAK